MLMKKLLVKKQNHSFLKKYIPQVLFQALQTTILIWFSLLHVCPSMPSLVFTVLLMPSFNVLSRYFYGSLNLVAGPTVRILIEFLTQLLQTQFSQTQFPSPFVEWFWETVETLLCQMVTASPQQTPGTENSVCL